MQLASPNRLALAERRLNATGKHSASAGNAANTSTFGDGEDRTAYSADVSLILNYQFAANWTLRIGYNAIWFGGQALATHNISPDPNVPLATIDHSGEVIFHGPSIGIVFAH